MKIYVVTTGAIFGLLTLAPQGLSAFGRGAYSGSRRGRDSAPYRPSRGAARRRFGVWNLLSSLPDPLAEDTIPALLGFYGPMLTIWGVTGFAASRRSGRVVDGVKAGTAIALVTFVFRASNSDSLRTFINYHYIIQSPFKILVATTTGACTGVIGGFAGSLMHPRTSRTHEPTNPTILLISCSSFTSHLLL